MRRLGIIAAILLLTTLLQPALCFAAAVLEIVDSYPRDGGTRYQPVNCAVKLYFNQDVSSERYMKSNSNCFRVVGPDETALPITVLYDYKDRNMVLVVINNDLESNTKYELTISGDFTASSGVTLDNDKIISFTTLDMSQAMTASMVMMTIMFVGILFFSSKQMKRQAQKAAEANKEEKVNPYELSKKTGKPVEEIVKKTEKQKQKKAAAEAKRKAKDGIVDEPDEEKRPEEENDNKRVKGPRPISAAGSTYRSGKKKKAEAEAARRAAARAAGTTRPKSQSQKTKNKKK